MNKPTLLSHFDEIYKDVKLLGAGNFGETHLVYDKRSKKYYSLKLLYPHDTPIKDYYREVEALKFLSKRCYPNIVCYVNHFIIKGYTNYKNKFINQTYYGILTEYINGVTLDQYKNQHQLSYKHILYISLWLLKTLSLIHSLGLAHNDISTSNIMITHQGQLKLIDFGLSCITSHPTFYNTCMKNRLVNEKYVSPEIQSGLYSMNVNYFSKTSDVFSSGLVLYELFTGFRPYRQDQHGNIISDYRDIQRAPCLNLILKKMLMIDPYKRSSAQQAYTNLLKCN